MKPGEQHCQCFDSDNTHSYVRKGNLKDGLALKSSYNDSDSSKTVEPVGSFPQGSVLRVGVADGAWSWSWNIEITIEDAFLVKMIGGLTQNRTITC